MRGKTQSGRGLPRGCNVLTADQLRRGAASHGGGHGPGVSPPPPQTISIEIMFMLFCSVGNHHVDAVQISLKPPRQTFYK